VRASTGEAATVIKTLCVFYSPGQTDLTVWPKAAVLSKKTVGAAQRITYIIYFFFFVSIDGHTACGNRTPESLKIKYFLISTPVTSYGPVICLYT